VVFFNLQKDLRSLIQNTSNHTFFGKSIFISLSFFVDFCLKIVVVRYLILYLGETEFGIWAVLKASIVFPLFLQQALSSAVFLGVARQEKKAFRFGPALFLSGILGCFIASGLAIFPEELAIFFQIPQHLQNEAELGFRLSAAAFVFTSFSHIFFQALNGLGRFEVTGSLTVIGSLLHSSIAVLLLVRGYGLTAVLLLEMLAAFLMLICGFAFSRILFSSQMSLRFRWNEVRRILRDSSQQLLFSFSGSLLWEFDGLFLPRIFGIATMTNYWLARRIPYLLGDFFWTGSWPILTDPASSKNSRHRLESIFLLQAGLVITVGVFLIFAARQILQLWIGRDMHEAALFLQILTLATVIDVLPSIYVFYLFVQDKVLPVARTLFGAALLKIVLTTLFHDRPEWVLLSTLAGAILFTFLIFQLSSGNQGKWIAIRTLPFFASAAICFVIFNLLPSPLQWSLMFVYLIAFPLTSLFLGIFILRTGFQDSYDRLIRFLLENFSLFHICYSAVYARKRRFYLRKELQYSERKNRYETMYQSQADPWNYHSSQYEKQKYSEMLLLLPKERFDSAIELGCSEGAFTKDLARRCNQVIALDISETALERARTENAELKNIKFHQMDIVTDSISVTADLICCGEILNLIPSRRHLEAVIRKISGSLRHNGFLLIANLHLLPDDRKGVWLGDIAFSSVEIQRMIARITSLKVVKEIDTNEYRITLYQKVE
jgi:O-antigen/teichoic acid export membrane protein/SAM-dependent methyltransferase